MLGFSELAFSVFIEHEILIKKSFVPVGVTNYLFFSEIIHPLLCRLFHHNDIPSERIWDWGDMCEYTEERLESGPRDKTRAFSK